MSQPSERKSTRASTPKCDRALKLHEQGIEHSAIAERLGVRSVDVWTYIKAGKARREKAEAQ